jgi:16S rRNA (cytidine1402-2'-O)-methyltransferase
VAPSAATLVFYESPRRLAQSLVDMAEVLGPAREAAVARELTKHFEEFRRGRLEELAGFYRDAPEPKGEIVVVVGPPVTVRQDLDVDLLLRRLAGEMTASRAAAEAARLTGLSRRELYLRLLQRPAQEGKGE